MPKEGHICGGFTGFRAFLAIPLFQLEITAFVALVAYSVSLVNGFTYDDYLVIVKNPWLEREGFLSSLFSQRYFDVSGEATYRPVITFLYWVCVSVAGINPFVFHLVSVLLHALTAVAVTRFA